MHIHNKCTTKSSVKDHIFNTAVYLNSFWIKVLLGNGRWSVRKHFLHCFNYPYLTFAFCVISFVLCFALFTLNFSSSHSCSNRPQVCRTLAAHFWSVICFPNKHRVFFSNLKSQRDYQICVTSLLCRSADFISWALHGCKWKLVRLSTGWATDVGYITTKSGVLHILSPWRLSW